MFIDNDNYVDCFVFLFVLYSCKIYIPDGSFNVIICYCDKLSNMIFSIKYLYKWLHIY